MRNSNPWVQSVLFAITVACSSEASDGGGEEVEKDKFFCTLGALDGDGVFQPLAAMGTAELYLGFQGFLLTPLRVRVEEGQAPGECDAKMAITVEQQEPFNLNQPAVRWTPDASGALLSDELLVFLTGGLPSALAGKTMDISIRLESDSAECVAHETVVLVDEDPCIHTGEEPSCPGDTEEEP